MVLVVGVGLVAGFALVAAFVLTFSNGTTAASGFEPESIDSVDRRIISEANQLDPVEVFYEQYPNGVVRVDRTGNEAGAAAIKYSFEKHHEDGKANQLRMFVMIEDRNSKRTGEIFLDCAVWYENSGGMTYSGFGHTLAEELRSTSCAK